MRPLENAMRVLSVREISCTAKAVFVTRASDEDRRSRRRGDDWRRSPSQSNLREAKGTALRPSSHGVAAPSRAAFAARQMRRAFVVRADRRNALMKRQFHLPNAPNMRISQCFQGCALHSHPKTGDVSVDGHSGPHNVPSRSDGTPYGRREWSRRPTVAAGGTPRLG